MRLSQQRSHLVKRIGGQRGPHDVADVILRQRQETETKPSRATDSRERAERKKNHIEAAYMTLLTCSSALNRFWLICPQSPFYMTTEDYYKMKKDVENVNTNLQHCCSGTKIEGSSLE